MCILQPPFACVSYLYPQLVSTPPLLALPMRYTRPYGRPEYFPFTLIVLTLPHGVARYRRL